jgi:signal transduction histidine kinase
VASAPELASVWRLRARADIAAVQLRAGRPGDAASTYASLEADFPEELREIVRPSRVQIAAAHSQALSLAGRRSEAQSLVLASLRDLEASGPEALAEDDVGLLLEKALSIASTPGDAAFRADLAPFRARHTALLRKQRFARRVRDWIAPRLLRGGERDRLEDPGGERGVVAWSRVEVEKGLAAVGFLLRPAAVLAVLEEALAAPPEDGRSAAPGDTSSLALRVETPPLSNGFQELASLPGAYRVFSVGMDRDAWEGLRGSARRPFRIAAAMIAALGLFLALSAAFAVLALRREVSLARLKTEFVANVSHELKTPLALIRLFGETLLLDRVRDPAKARGYHEIIVRESERLTHLVNNVLDFASIEAGQKKFDPEPTDLGRLVEDTVAAYRLQLEERGFQVSMEIAPGLPPIEADPDAVGQALLNLLDNAVKYSTDRKEVAVRVERVQGTVRVAVSDRGMGIFPRETRRVFETFYRSPAARRTGTRGSGLGLSLVRHILEAHGGSVELVSAPGKGSTFTLVFPARQEEPAGRSPVRPVAAGEQGDEGAVNR